MKYAISVMYQGERFPPAAHNVELDPEGNVKETFGVGVTDGVPTLIGPYDDPDEAQREADDLMLRHVQDDPDAPALSAFVLEMPFTSISQYLGDPA